MDYLDKIEYLKAKLEGSSKASAAEECIKQLEIARMIIASTETGAQLSDGDKSFAQGAINAAEQIIGKTAEAMLNAVVTTGQIPPELYNEDLPGAIPLERVSQVPTFLVRGKTYLSDSKKVSSAAPLFFLRGMQVVKRSSFSRHVAREEWCGYPKHSHDSEWLVLNYMIPGGSCVHVVALYTATPETLQALKSFSDGSYSPERETRPWVSLLHQFWMAEAPFCNERFKLIPFIAEGSWAIKMAVGQKPALTGKKLTQTYIREPGYLEIGIDVSSSSIATGILGMVRGVSKSMVVDLGIAIQGESVEELPEVVLCQTRFARVDLERAVLV